MIAAECRTAPDSVRRGLFLRSCLRQEEIALGGGDGESGGLHDKEHLFPESPALGEVEGTEEVAGVVRNNDGDVVEGPVARKEGGEREV